MVIPVSGERLAALPGEAVAGTKDGLRDVRDFLRAHRHDRLNDRRTAMLGWPLRGVMARAVSLVDDTLNFAEEAARSVRPPHLREADGPRGLGHYLADDGMERLTAERDFRRDMYAATKRSAAFFGLRDVSLREAIFARALTALRKHVRAGTGDRRSLPEAAAMAAIMLTEIVAADRQAARSSNRDLAGSVRLFAPPVLAVALASRAPHLAREVDLMEVSLYAVEARAEKIASALSGEEPRKALTRVFEALLPHLP